LVAGSGLRLRELPFLTRSPWMQKKILNNSVTVPDATYSGGPILPITDHFLGGHVGCRAKDEAPELDEALAEGWTVVSDSAAEWRWASY
jgi:hypothetical protein